jgi:amino acid adenylation domain-containing protein
MNALIERRGPAPISPIEAPLGTICGAFSRIAVSQGENEAVRWSAGSLSYHALDTRSDELARLLSARYGVFRGDLVGVALPRNGDLIVTLLAILKCGAAYVPLDPAYPPQRLQFMRTDSGAKLTITVSALADRFEDANLLLLDRIDGRPSSDTGDGPEGPTPSDVAYIIYTSGSTGVPKGVALTHAGVFARIEWARQTFSAEELGGMLLATSISFDVSVFELFSPLCLGGRVLIADNVLALPALPYKEEVRVVSTVPGVARELLAVGALPRTARTVCIAGELFPAGLAPKLAAAGAKRILNLYGPSEDTIFSTWTEVDPLDPEPPPIGRSLPGSRGYVLDENGSQCPPGEPGELFLTGVGLGRGYLNRPELNAQRFLLGAVAAEPGQTVYRTGDRVRLREDGQYQYLGRLDDQVKVMGRRIELGEIEQALSRQPGVLDCAVIAVDGPEGRPILAAYVQGNADVAALRDSLGRTLPVWMVPDTFTFVDAIPRSPNGKRDRKRLATAATLEPQAQSPPRNSQAQSGDSSVPIGAETREAFLARIFSETIGTSSVGLDDDLFALGGGSLVALRILARIRRETRLYLPLEALYEHSTPRSLAKALDHATPDGDGAAASAISVVPVATEGDGTPIFMVHWVRRELARHLSAKWPIYGLSYGLADPSASAQRSFPETVEELAAHYVDELQTVQSQGPYRLIGHSTGGVIAYEMARQLTSQGQIVEFLGFLDSYSPAVLREWRRRPLTALPSSLFRLPIRFLYWRAHSSVRQRLSRLPGLTSRFRKELEDRQEQDIAVTLELARRYEPKPYPGSAYFFKAADGLPTVLWTPLPPSDTDWKPWVLGGLTVHVLQADHFEIVVDPWAKRTAGQIEACLQGIDRALSPA